MLCNRLSYITSEVSSWEKQACTDVKTNHVSACVSVCVLFVGLSVHSGASKT